MWSLGSWSVIISMERVVDLWNHPMRLSESYLSFFFWPTFITGLLLYQLVLFRIALGLNVAMLHATISIKYSCAYICRTPEITFKCLIPKSPVLRFFHPHYKQAILSVFHIRPCKDELFYPHRNHVSMYKNSPFEAQRGVLTWFGIFICLKKCHLWQFRGWCDEQGIF